MPDAFKYVRLQNTFNRCKVHQILPLMVDYACINYQNVMRIQKVWFLQDLAWFLQGKKILQESCKNAVASKNWTFYKNLARFSWLARNLQDFARNKFLSIRDTCLPLLPKKITLTKASIFIPCPMIFVLWVELKWKKIEKTEKVDVILLRDCCHMSIEKATTRRIKIWNRGILHWQGDTRKDGKGLSFFSECGVVDCCISEIFNL